MLAYAHLEAGQTQDAPCPLEGIIASGQEFPSYVFFDAAPRPSHPGQERGSPVQPAGAGRTRFTERSTVRGMPGVRVATRLAGMAGYPAKGARESAPISTAILPKDIKCRKGKGMP